LDGIGSASSFLLTGVLAFFFTKGTDIAKSHLGNRTAEDKNPAAVPEPSSHLNAGGVSGRPDYGN